MRPTLMIDRHPDGVHRPDIGDRFFGSQPIGRWSLAVSPAKNDVKRAIACGGNAAVNAAFANRHCAIGLFRSGRAQQHEHQPASKDE